MVAEDCVRFGQATEDRPWDRLSLSVQNLDIGIQRRAKPPGVHLQDQWLTLLGVKTPSVGHSRFRDPPIRGSGNRHRGRDARRLNRLRRHNLGKLLHDHTGTAERTAVHELHRKSAADGGISRGFDANGAYLSQVNALQPDGRLHAALDPQRKDARDNGNIANLEPVSHLTAAAELPIANTQ